jgi:hypothetical protein
MTWLLRDRVVRLLAAFVLAPLAVIPVFIAYAAVGLLVEGAGPGRSLLAAITHPESLASVLSLCFLALVGAYAIEAVLGVPVFIFLEARHRVTRRALVYGGTAVGAVASLVVTPLLLLGPTPFVQLPLPVFWATCAVAGGVSGFALGLLLRKLPRAKWATHATES